MSHITSLLLRLQSTIRQTAGSTDSLGISWLGTSGRAIVLLHLIGSVLLFYTGTVDAFEFNKILLMRLAALVLAAIGLSVPLIKPRIVCAEVAKCFQDPIVLGIGLFCLSAGLSTILSISPHCSLHGAQDSYWGLGTIVACGILLLATRQLFRTTANIQLVFRSAVVSGIIAAIYALLQLLRLDPLHWDQASHIDGYVRPFGTLGHANILGGYLVMVLPLATYLLAQGVRDRRWLVVCGYSSGLSLMLAIIVFTLSRSAWLVLAGYALISSALWWYHGITRRPVLVAGTGSCLALMLSSVCFPSVRQPLIGRIAHLVEPGGRAFVWKTGMGLFAERPLVGQGLDTFALAFQAHRPVEFELLEWGQTPARAHNEVVQLLATQGLSGLLTMLVVMFGLLVASRRTWSRADSERRWLLMAIWMSMVGFGCQTLLNSLTVPTVTLFVSLLGVLSCWGFADGSADTTVQTSHRRLVLTALCVGPAVMWLSILFVWRPWRADVQCARAGEVVRTDPAEAVAQMEQAVALAPENDLYWNKLGNALRLLAVETAAASDRQAVLHRGQTAFKRAIALEPRSSFHQAEYARLLVALSHEGLVDPATVLATFDEAVRLDPHRGSGYVDAAAAAMALELVDRARSYSEQGLALYPDCGALRAMLGYLAIFEQRWEAGYHYLHDALHTSQWNDDASAIVGASSQLVLVCLRTRRYTEAIREADRTLELAPRDAVTRYYAARAAELLGRRTEAIYRYRVLLQDAPEAAGSGLRRLYRMH